MCSLRWPIFKSTTIAGFCCNFECLLQRCTHDSQPFSHKSCGERDRVISFSSQYLLWSTHCIVLYLQVIRYMAVILRQHCYSQPVFNCQPLPQNRHSVSFTHTIIHKRAHIFRFQQQCTTWLQFPPFSCCYYQRLFYNRPWPMSIRSQGKHLSDEANSIWYFGTDWRTWSFIVHNTQCHLIQTCILTALQQQANYYSICNCTTKPSRHSNWPKFTCWTNISRLCTGRLCQCAWRNDG